MGGSTVIWKISSDEKDAHTSTDFSRVLKDGWLGYVTRSYFSVHLVHANVHLD